MLTTILNVLMIILGFGVLIFVHELGHFIAAKWAGIRTEAFAVGMGPVAIAWRKGIGLRFGSTAPEYERRVHEYLSAGDGHQPSTKPRTSESPEPERRSAELPQAQMYRIGDKVGLGETEYSLRWLPIGGFVKMLGQEDANPNYVSDDPRSYNMRPIGKRMIVVSAGVIMNIVLAVVLFIIAFMGGVRFPAAIVGDVVSTLPAARAVADNAQAAGVESVGLQSGDRIVSIDGKPARTFADVQIASAMSKPGEVMTIVVERPGVTQPLTFKAQPKKDPASGLLSLGVAPGSSTRLFADKDEESDLVRLLDRAGLVKQGVKQGMAMVSVNDRDVSTFGQLAQAARESGGEPLHTRWATIGENEGQTAEASATLKVYPDYETYLQRDSDGDQGLLGFSPLVRFARVVEGSPNEGRIMPGDVLIKIANVAYPRLSQLFDTLKKHRREDVQVVVLRAGRPETITCHVNKSGKLLIEPEAADDLLMTSQPVHEYSRYRTDEPGKVEEVTTPASRSDLFTLGGTTILQVADQNVATWAELREALRKATSTAKADGTTATVEMVVAHPSPGAPHEKVLLSLTSDEVKSLHALAWHVDLPSAIFEPIYTVRQGNAAQAIGMGFEETHKAVMMVYLTIDRLVRGSVGVDQLRGPVGIVHIGTKVAREGLLYLLFFLGMISVNLAVINFLPMPIVDGGLFLFLIYEKLKGKPPSLAFQNAATIVGLLIIGTAFVVTFYNDVLRLLG